MIFALTLPEANISDNETANFFATYAADTKIKTGAKFIISEELINDDPGAIFIRMALDTNQAIQKFILGVCFSQFGRVATIDLVSLNQHIHRDIVSAYFGALDMLPSEIYFDAQQAEAVTKQLSPATQLETWSVKNPILIAGGYMSNTDGKIIFAGTSGDFTGKIFGVDVNALAQAVYQIICLNKEDNEVDEDDSTGFAQLNNWLHLINEHQGNADFYESFVDTCSCDTLTSTQLLALLNMKVADRVKYEGADTIQATIDEMVAGISRHISLKTVINKIIKKRLVNE